MAAVQPLSTFPYDEVIQLDWRQDKSVVQSRARLIDGISYYEDMLDLRGYDDLVTGTSCAPSCVLFTKTDRNSIPDPNGDRWMYTRTTKTSRKKIDGRTAGWWATYLRVIWKAYDHLAYDRPQLSRGVHYVLKRSTSWREEFKECVSTLATTLKVHPATLGFYYESRGCVFVPDGVKLMITAVDSVPKWIDTGRTCSVILEKTCGDLPAHVLSIRTEMQGNRAIRAVVIVEHASVKGDLNNYTRNFTEGLVDIMVIMTRGQADRTTREFVRQVGLSQDFRDVPIFFCCDHDVPGHEVYIAMKYGTKHLAWLSAVSTCPRIRYLGPTRQIVEDLIEHVELAHLSRNYSIERETSGLSKSEYLSRGIHDKKRQFRTFIDNDETCRIRKSDAATVTKWQEAGILALEPEAKSELEDIVKAGKRSFSLLKIPQWTGLYNIGEFIQMAVEKELVGRFPQVQPLPMIPSATPWFDRYESVEPEWPIYSPSSQFNLIIAPTSDGRNGCETSPARPQDRRNIGNAAFTSDQSLSSSSSTVLRNVSNQARPVKKRRADVFDLTSDSR